MGIGSTCRRLATGAALWAPLLLATSAAWANTIVCTSPAGALIDAHPIDVRATFITSNGQIQITVENLQSDPVAVTQALNSMTFQLDGVSLSNVVISASASTVTVNGTRKGEYIESTSPIDVLGVQKGGRKAPWSATESGSAPTFKFCDPACDSFGPAYLLIGGPNSNNAYASANGSITDKPHNPFLDQSMSFQITGNGLADAGSWTAQNIENVTFGFGTGTGTLIGGTFLTEDLPGNPPPPDPNLMGVREPAAAPEPSAAVLLTTGLVLVGLGGRRHWGLH
jgi:hypothetical protein